MEICAIVHFIMKIAVITCYHDPDYVRARSLRAALKQIDGVTPLVIKNTRKGFGRYFEVLYRVWQTRRQEHPDVYLLTFRGQEILAVVLLLAWGKPVWFDEFIVPGAYARNENHKKSFGTLFKHFLARISEPLYNWWLHRCKVILADTAAHAEASAKNARLNLSKYVAVPVGVDESVFKPGTGSQATGTFTVFCNSTGAQPLHGVDTAMAAAELLKDNENIEFFFVGGKRPVRLLAEAVQEKGARVRYERRIDPAELPGVIRSSGLCLGGPFGDTPQANNVVTDETYQMLACEAPVVVGASGATEEYFVDKKNALVVPRADPESLARAIAWASENPRELRGVAENGRKLFEKEFSTAAIARRLQPLVDSVV